MKRYFVLAVVALGLVFTACDEEENLNSSVWIGSELESNVIAQLDTLYLDARIENLSGAMRYLWTVDGKEVSTASTYKFSQPKTGEYSTFVAMVVGICIFIYLLTKVETVLLFVESIKSQLPVDSRYIGLVVKMVGITYVAEFAANLCRDSGYSAIAGQIEMFAKLSILVVSVPVFGAFLDAVGSFL